jgi:hypothetical protein
MAEPRGLIGAVREGRDGRLFLGRQDGFDLDLFSRGQPFGEGTLHRWRRTITRRARELGARGVPYVVFIVPDAPSVHSEDLPDDLARRIRPPGQLFLEALGDIEGVRFVYPLADLRNAKGGLEVYKKKDSHWTTFGSFVGYQSLMRAIQGLVPCHTVPASDLQFRFRRSYGDLGCLFEPEQSEEIPAVSLAGPEPQMVRHQDGVGRQTVTETAFPPAPCGSRALFFRDSFMTDLAPYLARSFSAMLTLGSTTRVMLDAVDDWRPDIVVSEIAERKLLFLDSDHQPEGYRTIFNTDYRSAHGRRLLQARIILGDDKAAALKLIADDLDALAADPQQAFSAGIIHEANESWAVAEELAHAALQARPTDPSFLGLAARCALGLGRVGEAIALARSAAEGQPYNGYFSELLAYSLLQDGQVEAALEAAESGLARIHDHPNLWYLASLLRASAQDEAGALPHLREAMGLDPGNPVYRALHEQISRSLQPVD